MPKLEFVTRAERRRRFSDEQKSSIVFEALNSGRSLAETARANDIAQSLLHRWIRDAKEKSQITSSAPSCTESNFTLLSAASSSVSAQAFDMRILLKNGIVIEACARLTLSEISALARDLGGF